MVLKCLKVKNQSWFCDGIWSKVRVWLRWWKRRKSLKIRGVVPEIVIYEPVLINVGKGCGCFGPFVDTSFLWSSACLSRLVTIFSIMFSCSLFKDHDQDFDFLITVKLLSFSNSFPRSHSTLFKILVGFFKIMIFCLTFNLLSHFFLINIGEDFDRIFLFRTLFSTITLLRPRLKKSTQTPLISKKRPHTSIFTLFPLWIIAQTQTFIKIYHKKERGY